MSTFKSENDDLLCTSEETLILSGAYFKGHRVVNTASFSKKVFSIKSKYPRRSDISDLDGRIDSESLLNLHLNSTNYFLQLLLGTSLGMHEKVRDCDFIAHMGSKFHTWGLSHLVPTNRLPITASFILMGLTAS